MVAGGEQEARGLRVERHRRPFIEEGVERFACSLGGLDHRPAGGVDTGRRLVAQDAVERPVQVGNHRPVKDGQASCELTPRSTRPEQQPDHQADRRTDRQIFDPNKSHLPTRG